MSGKVDIFYLTGNDLLRECESHVVADRTDIAQMIGDPLTLGQDAAYQAGARRNLDAGGVFLSPAELRRRWGECLKGQPGSAVVHMCGSGVTACHNLLAMELAGIYDSRLYVGSWSEWIRGPARPVATGRG